MRLLLTSAGVSNPAIEQTLVGLLGRPVAECDALAIPTAGYGHPQCGPDSAWRFLSGTSELRMTSLGWRSVGVLELTALPTVDRDRWTSWVQAADVLLVDGGDAAYLAHWLRTSGLADLLPELSDTVWVGLSAGSMVLAPRIGPEFVEWDGADGDRTLGVVDFSIFPHLDHELLPDNTLAAAQRWAAGLGNPAYAIDDDTAISVVDGVVDVVSGGHWRHFPG